MARYLLANMRNMISRASLQFAYSDILVSTHTDVAAMPGAARTALAANNWIVVPNYQKFEELCGSDSSDEPLAPVTTQIRLFFLGPRVVR